jgi:hypothetical protein
LEGGKRTSLAPPVIFELLGNSWQIRQVCDRGYYKFQIFVLYYFCLAVNARDETIYNAIVMFPAWSRSARD